MHQRLPIPLDEERLLDDCIRRALEHETRAHLPTNTQLEGARSRLLRQAKIQKQLPSLSSTLAVQPEPVSARLMLLPVRVGKAIRGGALLVQRTITAFFFDDSAYDRARYSCPHAQRYYCFTLYGALDMAVAA